MKVRECKAECRKGLTLNGNPQLDKENIPDGGGKFVSRLSLSGLTGTMLSSISRRLQKNGSEKL